MPQGPASLTRTLSERPLSGLVTVSTVPSGQVRAAAVLPLASNASPEAVRLPESYQLASTSSPKHLPLGLTYLWTCFQPPACAAENAIAHSASAKAAPASASVMRDAITCGPRR